MTEQGAILESLGAVDPVLILIIGVAIGVAATLGMRQLTRGPRKTADPLSRLFARETLDTQLAQFADPVAVSERKDREASAFRAKMFARRVTHPSETADVHTHRPPHLADRYDHAAVLAHVAKVMRAGTHLDEEAPYQTAAKGDDDAGDWEEVLLLPAPAHSPQENAAAKAA